MSAALATIFSFEKSRKWIIREGLTGISVSGAGAPIAMRLEEVSGVSQAAPRVGDGRPGNLVERRGVVRRDSPPAAVHGGMSELAESWALPERSRPPLLGELVERIDEALATARASEAAVMTVGAAAIDAAEQARRAAELAEPGERRDQRRQGTGCGGAPPAPSRSTAAARPEADEMGDFNARADRVAERLQRLQRTAALGLSTGPAALRRYPSAPSRNRPDQEPWP